MKSFLNKELSLDTFGRLPLTPYVLSALTTVNDENAAICVCRGYYEVEHSPPLIYYELLLKLKTSENSIFYLCTHG